jgi:hypothetical protein
VAFGAFFWIALTRVVWLRHGRRVGMLVRGVSLMHALIASPFLEDFLVLRPGSVSGIKLPTPVLARPAAGSLHRSLPGLAVRSGAAPLA